VIYQDDAFGKAVLDSAKRALAKHNAAPVATGSYTRNALDVGPAIESVHAAKPGVVLLASTYASAAEIVKRAHGLRWRPLFVSGSYIGTDAFITAAGQEAEGVVSTQIVPPYDSTQLPAVKLYRECLEKYMSATQPGFVSLEAFVNAMVIVEALKRAGKDPTREKFIAAIESMDGVDIGLGPEARLEFSSHHHKGLGHVYSTVVRGGKPEVFSDWAGTLAQK
jgi:branched-chain amino acid transport system substrate-binding protein